MIIGIIVAAAAFIGIVGYLYYKRRKEGRRFDHLWK